MTKRSFQELRLMLEHNASEHRVPILKPNALTILLDQILIHRPGKILEIGTAIGYSALAMAETMASFTVPRITTVEKSGEMFASASVHFAMSRYAESIQLIHADAAEWIETATEVYDLIFIDAAKAQYLNYFASADRLLPVGGVIVCDNVFFRGKPENKRYKTIRKRLEEFRFYLQKHQRYETRFFDIDDGLTVSVKRA